MQRRPPIPLPTSSSTIATSTPGAYGSPELDRAAVAVERASVSADGLTVELTTSPLVKDRVYLLAAPGVRSAEKESLVHPTGAYTLNEIPSDGE